MKTAKTLDQQNARLGHDLDGLPRDREQSYADKHQEQKADTYFHFLLRVVDVAVI
jgi:hypothetical protein